MKYVGVRKLKDKLSGYIRAAQAGERVIVTDRGRAVAELRPVTTLKDKVAELAARGLLTPGAGGPKVYPKFDALLTAAEVLRLLDDERGDR